MIRQLLPILVLLALAPAGLAADHAVILLYHRVSDTGPASTRVTPARFAAHLELIREGGYTVVPLAQLLDGIYKNRELPDRAVALTFDDAYRSVGEVAYPMLRARGMPFTVFVATDAVDGAGSSFLSWEQLQLMADSGLATFGPHSRSHAHLENLEPAGDDRAGTTRAAEIDGSLRRLRERLGDSVLDAFAYPYGEYSVATERLLRDRGLYGLAQQSGAVGVAIPATRIPRFPFYVGGDSDERLRTALRTRPLAMREEALAEVFLAAGTPVPDVLRLSPVPGGYRRDELRCYAASGKRLDLRWEGEVLALSLPPMSPGRNKVNCTAPARDGDGYFWYSRLWLLADPEGRWLAE